MTKRIFPLRCKGSMVKLKLGRNVILKTLKTKKLRIEVHAMIILTNIRSLQLYSKDFIVDTL